MEQLLTLVEVGLGNDRYLIDGDNIEKFINALKITKVYDAPDYIEGTSPWKEDMIPVIHFAPLLGIKTIDTGRRRILIIRKGTVSDIALAVVVDDVLNVRKVRQTDILPADISTGDGIEDYIRGIIRETDSDDHESVLLYLDLSRMLLELIKGRITRPAPDLFVWRWNTPTMKSS